MFLTNGFYKVAEIDFDFCVLEDFVISVIKIKYLLRNFSEVHDPKIETETLWLEKTVTSCRLLYV